MEARGNGIDYMGQGVNYVRASLNYGPMSSLVAKIYGWQSQKRTGYDQAFHTYTLEWTDKWMRVSVDTKVTAMIDLSVSGKGKSFWSVLVCSYISSEFGTHNFFAWLPLLSLKHLGTEANSRRPRRTGVQMSQLIRFTPTLLLRLINVSQLFTRRFS